MRLLRLASAAALSLSCVDLGEPDEPPVYEVLFECAQQVQEICLLTTDSVVVRVAPGVQAMDPAGSPDGKKIAFVAGNVVDGTTDIFVMNRDGSGITQLTFPGEIDDQPAWSPDGEKIVFRSFRTQLDGDIWVMDADGSNPVNLTPDPVPGVIDMSHPSWSPDGSRIAFASEEGGTRDIWTMSTTGGDKRQLTNTQQADSEPTWSGDGATIVFRRFFNSGASDIGLVSATGGPPTMRTRIGIERMPATFPGVIDALPDLILHVRQGSQTERPDIQQVSVDGVTGTLIGSQIPGGSLNPSYIRRP